MKTIEERAKEHADRHKAQEIAFFGENKRYSYTRVYNVELASYVSGAKEQKAIDIDKACEWFGTYLMEIGCPDDWLRDSLNIKSGKERFRKAMEE